MASKAKKLVVLQQLSQESEPIVISDLLEKLGPDYPERSVRRWLAEMIGEGFVRKFGQKKATKYHVIHRSESNGTKKANCFSPESIKIIKDMRRPLYERMPVTYSDDWIKAYQPNTTFYIPEAARIQLAKAGHRARKEDPAGTYAHQIFNRLLIDLSYNSSRLEGNTYSLLDTEKLLLEGKSVEGKPDEEKIMILNHKEAIRYLVDNAPKLEVNYSTVCTIHYLLSESLLEFKYAGKVRDYAVRIGGSAYIPFENKRQIELRLHNIIEKASLIEDPFEQSLFLLIHISYLQAFADVNKRTARLCANISLIKNNLVPSSFNDVEREDYTSAILAIYEMQDPRPLLDLYIFSYMRTCAMYDSTVKTIGYDEIRVRYRQERRQLLREIILNKMAGSTLIEYISRQAQKLTTEADRESFIEDTMQDLEVIDETRLFGLGVTPQELLEWKNNAELSP